MMRMIDSHRFRRILNLSLAVRVTCLGLGLLISACKPPSSAGGKASATAGGASRPVQVAKVNERPLERSITVLGSLAALEQATLSVKVPGRLQEIRVDLGSVVKKGDQIARIEPTDYELRLDQAEALLSQTRARLGLPVQGGDDLVDVDRNSAVKAAKAVLDESGKNRERVAALVQQGVLPQSELESAQASYEVALNRHDATIEEIRSQLAQLAQRRVEVAIARQQLDDTALIAPFDGAIQERRANRGEFLSASAPVVTLVRTDPLRLRLEVPEREASRVKAGQAVRLSIEGDTNIYGGSITRLSPAIIEQNRMLVVEADVPSRGVLRPGLFARADIVVRTNEPGLVVPMAALVSFAGLEKVFGIKEGKAVEKIVQSGRRGDGWVELTAGVQAGELVVLNPGNLQSGTPVITGDSPPAGKKAKEKAQPSKSPARNESGGA